MKLRLAIVILGVSLGLAAKWIVAAVTSSAGKAAVTQSADP